MILRAQVSFAKGVPVPANARYFVGIKLQNDFMLAEVRGHWHECRGVGKGAGGGLQSNPFNHLFNFCPCDAAFCNKAFNHGFLQIFYGINIF